jgi:hypothetical protein
MRTNTIHNYISTKFIYFATPDAVTWTAIFTATKIIASTFYSCIELSV